MNTRLTTLKTILWAMMGVLAVMTVARFARGLGGTTALSDSTPWGFWIAFDVMSGVALAAGGFVLAATVYIFGKQDYHRFVRPAILTAFLGYIAVAVGLLYDLGLPWHIWHPMIFPQEHSVLFEVAMCVMLYLTVLSLEFAPVVLEYRWFDRPLFRRIHRVLKTITIPLVITGIVLSTLHQSSLGSLFLITPYRLHPLWYTPIIWVLFLISAVGLGLMMVIMESFFSAWFFGHKLRKDLLAGLARAASIVLFVYAGLRLGDMAVRDVLANAFDGSWQASLFWFELLLSALVPATLLSFRRIRQSTAGLVICGMMTVMGVIGYRFDVCIEAFARPDDMPYFPSWMELAVSFGIVAGAMLVFIFFVERLKVYPEEHGAEGDETSHGLPSIDFGPTGTRMLLPDSINAPRRYSLAALTGAAVAVAILPAELFSGMEFPATPVFGTRTVDGWMHDRAEGYGHELSLPGPEDRMPADAQSVPLLMIDGNRDGRLVLFPHRDHVAKLGEQDSCCKCHHLNMPYDRNTSCWECHRDMYLETDIFDHSRHIDKLEGNQSCVRCHQDSAAVKSRDTALACAECHADMVVEDSLVSLPAGGMGGLATGYMDAMHGICIACHEQKVAEEPDKYPVSFAQCANCHRDIDATRLHEMEPYVTAQANTAK